MKFTTGIISLFMALALSSATNESAKGNLRRTMEREKQQQQQQQQVLNGKPFGGNRQAERVLPLGSNQKKNTGSTAASGQMIKGGPTNNGMGSEKKPHFEAGPGIKNNNNNNNNNKGRLSNNGSVLTKDIKAHKICAEPAKQYIVTCKDEKETECRDELEQKGVDIVHMIEGTKYFAVCVDSEEDYGPLMELADVDNLEEDRPRFFVSQLPSKRKHRRNLAQSVPYGVELVHAPEFWEMYDKRGEGVKVCVIDTGLDADHEDLGGYNSTIDGSNEGDLVFPWYEDGFGHGTHVAGTIAAADNGIGVVGVSPNVDLVIARVFDDFGYFTVSSLIDAMNECEKEGSDIISMSLGGPDVDIAESDFVDTLTGRGILLVAAAGNDGDYGNQVVYPAGYDSVMSVAAVDENSGIASFSTNNDAVDIAAPGVAVVSLESGGGTIALDGTSMATPHVSAVAALLMSEFPDEPASRIRKAMENSALDLGPCGTDPDYGHGLVDAVAAATYLKSGVSGRQDDLEQCWQCEEGQCDTVTVNTLTDTYGEETTWKIYRGSEIVLRGGPYAPFKQAEYTETYSLPRITDEAECYEFRVEDAADDGTCCQYGQGSHEFIFNGEQLFFEDQYESGVLSVTFGCVGDTPVTPAPTPTNGFNTPAPTPSAEPVDCPANMLNVEWAFKTDSYALETFWAITDDLGYVTGSHADDVPLEYENDTPYMFQYCLDPAACYTLTLGDTFGDGFCCGDGGQFFGLKVNGDTIGEGLDMDFGFLVEFQFGTCDVSIENGTDECLDLNGWVDIDGYDCSWFENNDSPGCPEYGNSFVPESGITPNEACCYCGDGGPEA